MTTLATVYPAAGPVGQIVELTGTGGGPNAQAVFDGIPAAVSFTFGRYVARVPAGLAYGTNGVTIVNLEGCQSQETRTFSVTAPSCGLVGIEPFAMLAALRVVRRLRRRD